MQNTPSIVEPQERTDDGDEYSAIAHVENFLLVFLVPLLHEKK